MCEMLFTTSLVAIVRLQESPRKLIILNTKRNTVICELKFPTTILCVKLNRKRLIVLLEESVHFYNIGNMKNVAIINTLPNPNGTCALSPSSEKCWFALPSGPGNALIYNAETGVQDSFIPAHKSPISCLAFGYRGDILATSSDKGTVIRVWSVPVGQCLYQFRRGTLHARITCMSFSLDAVFLAVSSVTETVHIFKLEEGGHPSSPASVMAGSESPISPTVSNGNVTTNELGASSTSSMLFSAGGRISTTLSQGMRSAGKMAAAALLPSSIITIFEPLRNYSSARIPGMASTVASTSAGTLPAAGSEKANGVPNSTLCCITCEGNSDNYSLFVLNSQGMLFEFAIQEAESRLVRQQSLVSSLIPSPNTSTSTLPAPSTPAA